MIGVRWAGLALALVACAHGSPEPWHPCDRAQPGPRVAPPWDGHELAGIVVPEEIERGRLRAAEITAGLLDLRARIDAIDTAGPCAGLAFRPAIADPEAAALVKCVGGASTLPPLVIILDGHHVESISTTVQLIPHGETITFAAAQYPVDCSAPEWAVDWTTR
jgi:hypothetical protein